MRGASPHVGQVRRPGRREPWRGGVASGWVRGAGGRADVNFIIAQTVADVTVTDQRGRGEPRLSARRSRDAGSGGARAASGDPSSVSHPQRLAVLVDPSTTLTTKSKGLGYRCPGESPGKSPRQRCRFPRLKSHVPQSCSQIRSRVPWTSRTDPADAAKRAAASALTNVEGAPEAYCYVSRVQSQSSLPQPLCSFLLLTTLMNIQPAGPGPI